VVLLRPCQRRCTEPQCSRVPKPFTGGAQPHALICRVSKAVGWNSSSAIGLLTQHIRTAAAAASAADTRKRQAHCTCPLSPAHLHSLLHTTILYRPRVGPHCASCTSPASSSVHSSYTDGLLILCTPALLRRCAVALWHGLHAETMISAHRERTLGQRALLAQPSTLATHHSARPATRPAAW
jgi:hypothetical protein